MLFAFIYLSRPMPGIAFRGLLPLIAVFTIWQVNDNADFMLIVLSFGVLNLLYY